MKTYFAKETQAPTTLIPLRHVPTSAALQQTGNVQRGTVNVSVVRVLGSEIKFLQFFH